MERKHKGEVIAVTDKQKRFCDEYLIDLNATQAAIRAGYSSKYANTNASKLLQNTTIKKYLDEQLKKIQDESIAKADEVLKYLHIGNEGREQVTGCHCYADGSGTRRQAARRKGQAKGSGYAR